MENIIAFVIIYIIAANIAVHIKKTVDLTMPISIMIIGMSVYVAGLFDKLDISIYIITMIAFISLILLIIKLIKSSKKKIELKRIITPGLFVYIIFLALNIIVNTGRVLSEYDEYSHWGLLAKHMYNYNMFGFGENSIVQYNEYPPLTGLFQYLILKIHGSYQENMLAMGQNLFYISMIMPIFRNIKWNKNKKRLLFVIPIILFLPLVFFKEFFISLYVDGLIGILFACLMYQIYKPDKNQIYRYLITISYIIALVLIKSTGIMFAIVALIFAIITIKKEDKNKKHRIKELIIYFLVAIFVLISWNMKVNISQATTHWDIEGAVENETMSQETKNLVIERYIVNFFTGERESINIRGPLTAFTATVLWIILSVYVFFKTNKSNIFKKKSIIMFVFTLIYIGLLLWIYLNLFQEWEARRINSFRRYIGTIILGGMYLDLLILVECKLKKRDAIIATLIIVLMYTFILKKQTVERYFDPYTKAVIVENIDKCLDIEKYREKLNESSKIYYIEITETGRMDYIDMAKYQMMPIIIGNKDLEDLVGTVEKFSAFLEQEGYTHVYIKMKNKKFENVYSKLFRNNIVKENTMYEIEKESESIILNEME